MILLLLVLVVLVAAAAAGLLGVGILSNDRRAERTGLLALLSAPVVLVFGVVVLGVLVVGIGGGDTHDDDGGPPTTAPASTRASDLPLARVETGRLDIPRVKIRPDHDDRFSPYQLVSGLAPGAVVRVQAEGFHFNDHGHVQQCVVELGHQTACAESFPVQFEDGRADFQFSVRGDIAPGGCRAGEATCLVRLTGDSNGARGSVHTVVGDRLVPGEVRVDPSRDLADGEALDVSVTGFPPGATGTAVLCAPPEAYDARRCSSASPASTFVVDGRGTGRTTLVVAAGRLGADRALCGPRRPCAVTVLVGPGFVAAPASQVSFTAGPGVDYDAGRLLTGMAIAALLVAAALVVAWRTDWTKPTEAATPELDDADLQADQDLDEIFGTDEEIDERYPIPWS